MKSLLFDQNLSHKLVDSLSTLFPGSKHVRMCNLSKSTDLEVWNFAKANALIIVTLDSDFSDFVNLYGAPPKVLWLRCGNQPTNEIENLLKENKNTIDSLFNDKNISIVELF